MVKNLLGQGNNKSSYGSDKVVKIRSIVSADLAFSLIFTPWLPGKVLVQVTTQKLSRRSWSRGVIWVVRFYLPALGASLLSKDRRGVQGRALSPLLFEHQPLGLHRAIQKPLRDNELLCKLYGNLASVQV